MKDYRDASNRMTFFLSGQEGDFGRFATRMTSLFGKPIKKLNDNLGNQQYWDFSVEGTIVVLHSDVMVGVSIHIEDGSNEALLREIAEAVTRDNKSQNWPTER